MNETTRVPWTPDSWRAYRARDKDNGLTGHIGKDEDIQRRANIITELNIITGANNLIDYGVNEYLYTNLNSNINITSIEIDPDAKATLDTYILINGNYRELVSPQNNTIYTYHLFMDTTREQSKLAKEVIYRLVNGEIQNSYMIVWERISKETQNYTIYNLSTGKVLGN